MSKGIACPACGCPDLRTTNTLRSAGRIKRYKECRHCGKRVVTYEKIDPVEKKIATYSNSF